MKYYHIFIMFLVFAIFELIYLLNMGIWTLKDWETGERDGSDTSLNDSQEGVDGETSDSAVREHKDDRSHLAVVACGHVQEGALNLLKSAVLFSKKPLQFYIFAEDNQHESIRNTLKSWPKEFQNKFNFTTHSATYPEGYEVWKGLFKPCATLRIFLPIILKEVDSLVYVDADTVFLQPVEDIWALLSQFNSSQLAAMSTEREDASGWYSRTARHPYYGKYGLNSGVILMNMTRIREKSFKNDMTTAAMKWDDMLDPLYQKYKDIIPLADQDVLNIIFNQNPECLYQLPCSWNYRSDFCISKNCQHTEREGVSLLHGNRNCFYNDTQPAFKAVYEAIQKADSSYQTPICHNCERPTAEWPNQSPSELVGALSDTTAETPLTPSYFVPTQSLENSILQPGAGNSEGNSHFHPTKSSSVNPGSQGRVSQPAEELAYQFGDNMVTTFLQPLEEALKNTSQTHCGKYRHLFTKKLRQLILRDQQNITQS